jgi:ribonuclease HII
MNTVSANGRQPRSVNLVDEVEHELRRTPPPRIIEDAAPNKPDIGRMSAEAVLAQYEATAKDVEALGETVKDWVAKLEAVLKDCHEDLKLISDAAQHVRKKGDEIHAVIEQATSMSKIIRDTCADFTSKVGA